MGCQKWFHLCPPIFHTYFWRSSWCEVLARFVNLNLLFLIHYCRPKTLILILDQLWKEEKVWNVEKERNEIEIWNKHLQNRLLIQKDCILPEEENPGFIMRYPEVEEAEEAIATPDFGRTGIPLFTRSPPHCHLPSLGFRSQASSVRTHHYTCAPALVLGKDLWLQMDGIAVNGPGLHWWHYLIATSLFYYINGHCLL